MKPALRWIPTEVWVDVFRYPWISREELGRIVDRFRNRKFTEFLQFFLHDWGKRTLDWIFLGKALLDIPRTSMPENIKFFERITIWHFDSRTLDFLRQISTLFIRNDVNLWFDYGSDDLPKVRTILDYLAPLIRRIHSLSFNQAAIPLLEQYFALKLPQIKMLSIKVDVSPPPQAVINFLLNWLTSSEERDSAEPRLLKAYTDSYNIQQFSLAVQQQFHSAKRRCTFAIQLIHYYGRIDYIAGFHLENNRGEQLHGEYKGVGYFQIVRHQPNAGTALQGWIKETYGKSYESSVIELPSSLTIGPIDVNAGANEVNDAGAEDDGPSTSKKPKLTQ